MSDFAYTLIGVGVEFRKGVTQHLAENSSEFANAVGGKERVAAL
jgi:hypothetical protein